MGQLNKGYIVRDQMIRNTLSDRTRCDTSDNVCQDLENWHHYNY